MAKVPTRAKKTEKKETAAASAAPGTEDKKAEKVKKVDYPGLWQKDEQGGDDIRLKHILEAVPEDFDPEKHNQLKRHDFKCPSTWFFLKADEYEAKAKEYRAEGEEAKKLGGAKERQQAKKLQAMQKRMAELQASLKAQGIDVDALLSNESNDEKEE